MLDEILSNTYTLNDARYRLGLLERALQKRFFSGDEESSLKVLLKRQVHEGREEDADAVAKWKNIREELTAENMREKIKELSTQVEELPTIVLYVPCNISGEELVRIGGWLRDNVQKNIMIDMKIDPWIAGGCAFVWNNKYYDYSFRYFAKQHKKELEEMMGEMENTQ